MTVVIDIITIMIETLHFETLIVVVKPGVDTKAVVYIGTHIAAHTRAHRVMVKGIIMAITIVLHILKVKKLQRMIPLLLGPFLGPVHPVMYNNSRVRRVRGVR